jgi:hypothetical protein
MTLTLMCSKSPLSLGIVENYRMINLDNLHDHVDGCDICRQYYNENIFKLLNRIITMENQELSHAERYSNISSRYQNRKYQLDSL